MFDFEMIFDHFLSYAKELMYSDVVNAFFMDYSKNEIITMLYLSQQKKASMGQIAEYIHAPLNTASGVVTRLVQKDLAERIRDEEDRRVVHITLTRRGSELVEKDKKKISQYMNKILEELTKDEIMLTVKLIEKIIKVMRELDDGQGAEPKSKAKIRKIAVE